VLAGKKVDNRTGEIYPCRSFGRVTLLCSENPGIEMLRVLDIARHECPVIETFDGDIGDDLLLLSKLLQSGIPARATDMPKAEWSRLSEIKAEPSRV